MAVEWVRLQLDLEAFEDARFEPYLQGCRQSGIDFTTMADLGDTADCRRSLYELNKTCSADIPERGEFYTFDEYLNDRIEIPTYHPRGVVLAISNGVWIGMAATSLRPSDGYAFSKMSMTAPGCGMGDVLKEDARTAVQSVPGVSDIDIELVWDPPWGQDRMSEAARLQLGMF